MINREQARAFRENFAEPLKAALARQEELLKKVLKELEKLNGKSQ